MARSHDIPGFGSPLGILCACLSVSGDDAELRDILSRRQIDWYPIVHLADGHLVTPQLTEALERRGLSIHVDAETWEYLEAVRSLNRDRNEIHRSQLLAIADALSSVGVTPLLIKGAIALTPGQYPGAFDRIMGDLDIVVPESTLLKVQDTIKDIGYVEAKEAWRWDAGTAKRDANHIAPLLHKSLPVCVEVHHRVLGREDDELLAPRLQEWLTPPGWPHNFLIPDPSSRLVQSFFHSQIRDELAFRRLINLRQLYEFASLARFYEGQYSGELVRSSLRRSRIRRLEEYWEIARRLMGAPVPDGIGIPSSAARELWLISRVMQHRPWRVGSDLISGVVKLPQRVQFHASLLMEVPGYSTLLSRRVWRRLRGQPVDG